MSIGGTRASGWYLNCTGADVLAFVKNLPAVTIAGAFTAGSLQNADGVITLNGPGPVSRALLSVVSSTKLGVTSRMTDGTAGTEKSAASTNDIATTGTNRYVVTIDWQNSSIAINLNGVETVTAIAADWGGLCSNTDLASLIIGRATTSMQGQEEEVMAWGSALTADQRAAVIAALSGTGPWSAVPAVGMRIPLRGQSGVAVPTLPVLSGTIGDVSMGIATPSGSPTYGTDLTPEPPQRGPVGMRFMGSGAQYMSMSSAGVGKNVAGLAVVGFETHDAITVEQKSITVTTPGGLNRLGVATIGSGAVRVIARRLDGDSSTTVDSTATIAVGQRAFVGGVCYYSTGSVGTLVGGTIKKTAVAGWDGPSSNTNNGGVYISTQSVPLNALLEQPLIISWTAADGDPPDAWFEELRLANGRYIPAPWGAGVEIYDLSTTPDFRAGDAVPSELPIRKTMLSGVTAAGIARPVNGPTFQESLLSEPMWRPRISGGASRIRTQSYWNIVGAGGLTRAASALTLEWWGELCAVPNGGGIVGISTGGSASNVRIGARLSATGLLVGSARRADADSEVTSTSAAGVLGESHVVVTIDCATRALTAYLNGVAATAGTLSVGALTEDTDALAILVGRSLAGGNSCARHGLVTLHRRAMTGAEALLRYKMKGRVGIGDAAMYLDFRRVESDGKVRCLVNPSTCYAQPVNSPVTVLGNYLDPPIARSRRIAEQAYIGDGTLRSFRRF